MRLILPIPSLQGSNSRAHYRVRIKDAKADRFIAALESRAIDVVQLKNPIVSVLWYCRTKRMLDCDNALSRCKSYIDGLTDAGWWSDDKKIVSMTVRVLPPNKVTGNVACVHITADEAPECVLRDPL